MYYPSSENKGADQLRGYREADLCLCFRKCRLLVFPRGGSYHVNLSSVYISMVKVGFSSLILSRFLTLGQPYRWTDVNLKYIEYICCQEYVYMHLIYKYCIAYIQMNFALYKTLSVTSYEHEGILC